MLNYCEKFYYTYSIDKKKCKKFYYLSFLKSHYDNQLVRQVVSGSSS